MPELKPDQLLLFAGFVLPGAISMYVYALKVPQREFQLKDRIVEAICFSLLNFVVVWSPARWILGTAAASRSDLAGWLVMLVAFVLLPAIWPFALVALLRWAEGKGWINVRAKTAWDDFFEHQKSGCWLQVELNDGRVVGGRFGTESYASALPDPGHLLLEELWTVDENGGFVDPWPGNAGLLLRPTDYRMIRIYTGAVA